MASRGSVGARVAKGSIPFGLLDGRMVGPADVARGRSCRCSCPGCGAALLAKQGSKVPPYFAHDRVRPGPTCAESSLHRYAKQVISDADGLRLPAWDGTPTMPNPPTMGDGEGRLAVGQPVGRPDVNAAVKAGRTDVPFGSIRVDVATNDEEGELLVEIRVTHAVDEEKLARVRALRLRMIEIDVSGVSIETLSDPTRFAQWVRYEAPRYWVSHPVMESKWADSRSALEARVRERIPAFGPGEAMLVRLQGIAADTLRLLCSTAAASTSCSEDDPMIGCLVWLEGRGEAILVESLDLGFHRYRAICVDGGVVWVTLGPE